LFRNAQNILERQKQEDLVFEASLGYILSSRPVWVLRSYLKNKQTNKTQTEVLKAFILLLLNPLTEEKKNQKTEESHPLQLCEKKASNLGSSRRSELRKLNLQHSFLYKPSYSKNTSF
jgi:hypothetical protein